MRRIATITTTLLAVAVLLVACGNPPESEQRRQADAEERFDYMEKASSLYPIPELANFPMRRALVKYTERQDLVNHPWFIYLYAMDGSPLGYYVGQTYPQSTCNFLSSSETMVDRHHDDDDDEDFIVQAPSLDGIYYGGGGSSASCQGMFFFDMTTDAMHVFTIQNWTASDQPDPNFAGPALGETTVEDVAP